MDPGPVLSQALDPDPDELQPDPGELQPDPGELQPDPVGLQPAPQPPGDEQWKQRMVNGTISCCSNSFNLIELNLVDTRCRGGCSRQAGRLSLLLTLAAGRIDLGGV